MTIRIREARLQDATAVADLWHEMAAFHARCHPLWRVRRGCKEGYAAYMQDVVRASDKAVFVACDGPRPVGFVLAQLDRRERVFIDRDHGLIVDLTVTEAYRRRGVGTALFGRARRWFAGRGVKRLEVRAATANPVSTAFWRKMGFEPYMTLCRRDAAQS